MNAPLTRQNYVAWMAMVDGGMSKGVVIERMTDWAAMLEKRLAELDPQYQGHQFGRNEHSLFNNDGSLREDDEHFIGAFVSHERTWLLTVKNV